MVVNKIAVIAIVAILAVPILLGYGFNLTETEVIEYKPTDNGKHDITGLLETGIDYTQVNADLYSINSDFRLNTPSDAKVLPYFTKSTLAKTAYPYMNRVFYNQTFNNTVQPIGSNVDLFYEQFDYVVPTVSLTVDFYTISGGTESLFFTVNNLHSIYYDHNDSDYYSYSYYTGSNSFDTVAGNAKITKMVMTTSGGTCTIQRQYNNNTYYVDLAAGYYYNMNNNSVANGWGSKLPSYTSSVLLTLNLSSITDSNYSIQIGPTGLMYTLIKTTSGGNVTWKVEAPHGPLEPADTYDLLMDEDRTDNTYQILFTFKKINEDSNYRYYSYHTEFRYVGSWPTLIGYANPYITITDDRTVSQAIGLTERTGLDKVVVSPVSGVNVVRSPIMRVDAATYRGFQYSIISDKTFLPGMYVSKYNEYYPSIQIKDIMAYGTSITFGGQTYNINDGDITVGTREWGLSSVTFDSIPVGDGNYNNRINGYVVSTTLGIPSMTFNGNWAANVVVDSLEQSTYTTTQWNAGEFAWDGIDQNFLIVGLIASLGVFIALGIYARRSKSAALIPLMIVCGGAAMLFFVML